jgi:aryl-alcohol dehydrogenase-like predicted oxidoreductase
MQRPRVGSISSTTADVYPLGGGRATAGRTEEIVGAWLKGKRQQFILATKCAGQVGAQPWDQGTSRKHILDAIDASLRRLGTDYVDLYQVHRYDADTPMDETLEALDMVVRQGKARYVGVSNWPAWRVARGLGRGELKNLCRIDSVQPRYNLLFRAFERDLLPLCEEEAIAVIPYNPLAGGLLSGKHDGTVPPPEGTRFSLRTAGTRYQARTGVCDDRKPAHGGPRRGHEHGHACGRLGLVQSRHHRTDRRCEPPRATGRQPGCRGEGCPAARPHGEARRTDAGLACG